MNEIEPFTIEHLKRSKERGTLKKRYLDWVKEQRKEDRRLAYNEYMRKMAFLKRKERLS